MAMSSSTTSATRRSRSDFDAWDTAAAAAFSHDWVLVPMSSTTVYTLSAMTASVLQVAHTLVTATRRLSRVRPAARLPAGGTYDERAVTDPWDTPPPPPASLPVMLLRA